MVNTKILKNNHICHTIKVRYITYNNADMIQQHLDAQEHIWKTSGHLEQYRTGHHLQMWHNQHRHITSMAL